MLFEQGRFLDSENTTENARVASESLLFYLTDRHNVHETRRECSLLCVDVN